MKLSNGLTPYPILCSFNDDYRDSQFTADIHCNKSLEKIKIDVAFHLQNDELQKMIQEGKAKYLLHIESPKISLRRKIITNKNRIEEILEKDEVTDSIEVCTFIVAAEDIHDYHNSLFNALDADLRISLSKGNIIAIGTRKEFILEKNDKESRDAESLIKIQKLVAKEHTSLSVNTDNEKYLILGLDESVFDLYWKMGQRKYREVIISMVLLPAMITVLMRMKKDSESNEESQFEGKEWYMGILELLENAGYSLEELKEEDNSVLEAAQTIFQNPIKTALNALDANDVEEE